MKKIVLAMLGLALVAAACGSTEETPSSASGASGGSATSITIKEAPTTTAAPFDQNATFRWIYSVDTTSFDPDKITTNNSNMFLWPIYDTLTWINENAEIEPLLAEKWEIGADGKTLTFHLIKNWKFHDGTPFNADAVKKNLERSMTLPGSFNASRLKPIKLIEVVDDSTIRLTTDGAAAPLIGIMAGSAGMMMSPAVFDKPGEDKKPTGGSGAYQMTNYVPGQRVEYTAVPNYWDKNGQKVNSMVFLVSGDDNARLNAVITNVADATFLRPAMVKPAEDAKLVIKSKPSLSTYNITFNTQKAKFSDKRVRQALNYAIDRNSIATLMGGLCTPNSSLFADFYWAGSKDAASKYTYNPEKAKQLLSEAGGGFSFTLNTINLAQYQQIAELIQQNLKAVGVDMTINIVDLQRLTNDFQKDKTADAIIGEQKGETDPSVLTAQYFLAGGLSNPGGYTTPEITKMHEDALKGSTTAERGPAYKKLMDAVAEEAYPNIGLCQLTTPFASNAKVQGLPIPADGSRWFRGVSMAK